MQQQAHRRRTLYYSNNREAGLLLLVAHLDIPSTHVHAYYTVPVSGRPPQRPITVYWSRAKAADAGGGGSGGGGDDQHYNR